MPRALRSMATPYNIGAAARLARAAYKDFYSKSNEKGGGKIPVVTRHHDVKSKKIGKKTSKRKKKWLNFVQKVEHAVNEKESMHCMIESCEQGSVLAVQGEAEEQHVITDGEGSDINTLLLGLYNYEDAPAPLGASGPRRFLIDLEEVPSGTVTAGGAPQTGVLGNLNNFNSREFYLSSSKMNWAYENDSNDAQMLDIYECVARVDIDVINYSTPYKAFKFLLGNTWDPASALTGLTYASRALITDSGMTPFQVPEFGKYWKILKKTRVESQPDERIVYQMSGYRGKIKAGEDLKTYAKAGKTKSLLIIVNPTSNHVANVGETLGRFEWTKTYNFKWKNAPINQQSVIQKYHYV